MSLRRGGSIDLPERAVEQPPRDEEPMWRPAIRFILALAISAALAGHCGGSPNDLLKPTDIIGYPIFADFDVYRYTYGYYVIAGLFPALAIVAYVILRG